MAALSRLVFGQLDEAKSWLRDEHRVKVGIGYMPLLVWEGERIKGCVLFFSKNANDIELGVFGEGILTRRMIRAIGAYAFIDNACARITAKTHEGNAAARHSLLRAGFKEEGRIRKMFDDGDAILYGLLRDESKLWQSVK